MLAIMVVMLLVVLGNDGDGDACGDDGREW